MKQPGKLILFEGCEGSGKDTQIIILRDTLELYGLSTILTREPSGKFRNELEKPENQSTQARFDIFMKDRTAHFKDVIIPALNEGRIVLLNRSSLSTYAYQCFAGGMAIDDVLKADDTARQGRIFDLTFVLDIDPKVGLQRKKQQNEVGGLKSFEKERLEFHEKVRQGYLWLAQRNFLGPCIVIDASKPVATITDEIWQHTTKLLII